MEDELNQPEELAFSDVLAALQDESQPLAARYLYPLSGLEADDLAQLRQIWPRLSTQRRVALLEDLELLAESNTVMHFDAVNRMALADADSRVRRVAVRGLWPSEQASLAAEFIRMLRQDADTDVRAQTAAALGRFVYLGEVGRIPAEVLANVEDALLEVLNGDEDPDIERRALEAMGYSSRPEVLEFIENAYESGEEEWVVSALFAMGRSADQRWAHLVIQSLGDANRDISREAARAAGELELSEARPGLFDLLGDEESEVRLAAAWALSQIGGNGIADALEELIERSDDEDEIELLESAIENLELTEELSELNLMDFSQEDLDDLANGHEPDDEAAE